MTPGRASLGAAAAAVAEELGQPLMPWQRLVADVGLELTEDGRPAFREVMLTVPRQSGKTHGLLVVKVQRALGWSTPQRILYSAQTGNDARKKLVEDWSPVLERSRRSLGITRILRGMGNESVEFRNGSRIVLLASSEDSGHGKTVDLAVHDEIFADTDNRREQATIPAMATKPSAQMWLASTMGTDESVFLNRKVDVGRMAAERGQTTGMAYFEWSAPEDADIDDPETWYGCMPALGHTINEEVVRHARQTMTEGEFRRAFLNQRTHSDERVISAAVWDAVNDDKAGAGALPCVGIDVNPERSAAAVAMAGAGTVELVEHRPGVGWLVERAAGIAKRWRAPILVDPYGPAGLFIPDLEDQGARVVPVGGNDMAQACGAFYDDIAQSAIVIRRALPLDVAVAAARKGSKGDAWVWARKTPTEDVSPLVAVTLAWWGQRNEMNRGAAHQVW
jgi:hypothetical protein